jgi:signal transduction histidine kinase
MAMSGVAVAVVVLFAGLWIAGRLIGFSEEASAIRAGLLEEKKLSLRATVDEAVSYVEFAQERAREALRADLRERVDQAHVLAAHLVATQGAGKDRAALEALVRDALRPLRFNGGRGYFFAFDLTGVKRLSPIFPGEEGRDMTEITGGRGERVVPDMLELARRDGAGFVTYSWNRPQGAEGTRDREKISYIRLFEPLGWVIGAGEYLADSRQAIQERVLNRLATIQTSDGSYVFVGDWDGVSLAGPAHGRDMMDATDLDGVKVVQSLIEQAKLEPGFLTYRMPGVGDRPTARKISYVRGVPAWRWYVGAGLFIDDLDAVVEDRRARLLTTLVVELGLGFLVTLLTAGLILFIQRRVAARLRKSHDRFTQFLTEAAHGEGTLDPEQMDYAEYRDLAIFVNHLIDARREAERRLEERGAQLERSNRELERFAFVASHDLQEPLRNISGFVQLIDRRLGAVLDGESREFFGYVRENVRRMRAQILGLLEYSRLDRMPLERTVVPLDSLIQGALRDLGPRIAETRAEVVIEDLPAVAVDAGQTRILFLQLLDNALTFRAAEPPHVVVSASRRDDGRWWITVADNGRGIAEEDREKVFEVFKRLDGSGDRPGAGLGLSICRRIVARHGGEIELEPRRGGGTRVTFSLSEVVRRPLRAAAG